MVVVRENAESCRVVHAFDPSTREAEVEGAELYSKTLFPKANNTERFHESSLQLL